jgi:hypothetical protein
MRLTLLAMMGLGRGVGEQLGEAVDVAFDEIDVQSRVLEANE